LRGVANLDPLDVGGAKLLQFGDCPARFVGDARAVD